MRKLISSLVCCSATATAASAGAVTSPVLIVPGDGSNQLEAKLDKPSVTHLWCDKKADWFRLWLSTAELLVPTALDCWCDNIRLAYDATTDALTNAPGVSVRAPDFGGTSSLEELDPSVPFSATAVFKPMVDALVGMAGRGYARNSTVRGAPYDFRYAPTTDTGFGDNLRALIEATSAAQGGAKLTLVSHSMGCLQTQHFLASQTPEWKAAHVARWVAISGPYGGANSLLRLHASGDAEGLPGVKATTIRAEQRSYETNLWMLPQPAVWGADEALARIGTAKPNTAVNYSAAQLEGFLAAVGYGDGPALLRRVGALRAAWNATPGVETHCLYSTGVATPRSFAWASDTDFDAQPVVSNGDGDGTVCVESLRVCEGWVGAQAEPVTVKTFSAVKHADMVKDAGVIAYLQSLL